MTLKPNKRKLINYVTIKWDGSIYVPSHRIVRSKGFQKNLEAVKRISEKINRNQVYIKEKLIQRFQGYIVDINNDTFEVRFSDVTNPSNPEEYHTFYMSILSKVKQRELQIYENVYWDFYKKPDGKIKTQLKFIEPKKITNREIREAKKQAQEIASFFNDNTGE